MPIRKLDLGGTACYESNDAISISRYDFENSGDEITRQIGGDYNRMPFADDTFDEALGSCYLEDPVDWQELFRVMRKGSTVRVKSCGTLYDKPRRVYAAARRAGFEIVSKPSWCPAYHGYDEPLILRKP